MPVTTRRKAERDALHKICLCCSALREPQPRSEQFLRFSSLSAELRLRIWAEAALEEIRWRQLSPGVRPTSAIDIAETFTAGEERTYVLWDEMGWGFRRSRVAKVNQEARREVWRTLALQPVIPAIDYYRLDNITPALVKRVHGGKPRVKSQKGKLFDSDAFKFLKAGKKVQALALNVTKHGPSGRTHRSRPWKRFRDPEDFLGTITRLFGSDIETLYLYDGRLAGNLNDRMSNDRYYRDETDTLAVIEGEMWYLPEPWESGATFHLFGDVNQGLFDWSPSVMGPSTPWPHRPGVFEEYEAARISVPGIHTDHAISGQYGEVFRVRRRHRPALIKGMWSQMLASFFIPKQAIDILEQILEKSRTSQRLPKLEQISIMTPVLDYDLDEYHELEAEASDIDSLRGYGYTGISDEEEEE